jgi:PAS domain S-box-containing protein
METINNTILIIEDDLGLNELISEKIKELGFQTYSVFSVDEAINWLSEFIPHLMVVDYSLSDSTAKYFIDIIKAKGLPLPPFVVTTGQGDERIAVEMMKLGARDYIIKDTNLLELLPNIIGRVAKEIDNENKLKFAENELKESEIRFRKLLQDIQTVSVQGYAPDGTTQYWNKASERLYGYTAEEAIGKNLIDLIIPTEMRTGVKQAMEQMANSGQAIPASELTLKRKDDSHVTVFSNHAIVQVTGQPQELFCIDIDLTEIKQTQEALRESERVLLKSQQIAQLGSYSWDISKGYWNSSAILDDIFGIDENYIRTTQGWLDLIHPDWQDSMNDYITHDIVLNHQRFDKEYKIIRKDNGEECWVHGLGDLEFDSSNNPIKLFGTISNINQRKMAEIALKESEEKFRILFADNPQPMFVYNIKTYDILEVNQTAVNFYGYTKDECHKMTIKELHPSEEIQSFLKIIEQTKMGINTDGITKHIKKNREIITVEIFSAAANYWGENARLALVVDITERKKMEEAVKFLITCGVTSSGEDFFESLAKYLSQILDMEYVCIDKLDPDGLTAHTLANYNDGTFDTNISYTLHQTPCGEVVGKTICCFPENVCKLFPYDYMLGDMKAESYVGTTLWSFDGKAIGLIAIIGRKPLKNTILAENILRLVSVRAAGELERKKGEEALIKKNADLDYMNKFMVNREVRMADMKKEVNELLERLGEEKRYL